MHRLFDCVITLPFPIVCPIGYSTFVRDEKCLFSFMDEGGDVAKKSIYCVGAFFQELNIL